MTITYTPKFGLPQYGDKTVDGPTMAQWNALLLSLESHAAYDAQGTTPPSAGYSGRYYWNTGTKILARDNGTSWDIIGQNMTDEVVTNSAVGTVASKITALASTTADLLQISTSGATQALKYTAAGLLVSTDSANQSVVTIGSPLNPLLLALSSTSSSAKGIVVNAATAFAGTNVLEIQNNGTAVASISKIGGISGNTLALIASTGTALLTATDTTTQRLAVLRTGEIDVQLVPTTPGLVITQSPASAGQKTIAVKNGNTTPDGSTEYVFTVDSTAGAVKAGPINYMPPGATAIRSVTPKVVQSITGVVGSGGTFTLGGSVGVRTLITDTVTITDDVMAFYEFSTKFYSGNNGNITFYLYVDGVLLWTQLAPHSNGDKVVISDLINLPIANGTNHTILLQASNSDSATCTMQISYRKIRVVQ